MPATSYYSQNYSRIIIASLSTGDEEGKNLAVRAQHGVCTRKCIVTMCSHDHVSNPGYVVYYNDNAHYANYYAKIDKN